MHRGAGRRYRSYRDTGPGCKSRLRELWWREGVAPETGTRPPRKCERSGSQVRETEGFWEGACCISDLEEGQLEKREPRVSSAWAHGPLCKQIVVPRGREPLGCCGWQGMEKGEKQNCLRSNCLGSLRVREGSCVVPLSPPEQCILGAEAIWGGEQV